MIVQPKKDEQAREVVQHHFMLMLQSMMQLGMTPERMLYPYMEQLASVYATIKMRGNDADLESLILAFRTECSAATQRILVAGNPTRPQ